MLSFVNKKLPFILLWIAILAFSIYFSLFTILRNEKMYAHYFDLGIMHQTVYNTYMSLKTGDMDRFLELTNPHDGAGQVKRMAIHNDMFLALLAPFYFIHAGPETLLVIQATVVALGALFIFLLAQELFSKSKHRDWIALVFSLAYLLYPAIQKATAFEFHAVTLVTTFILGMYYFWLKKRYISSFIMLLLALSTKEQIGMTTAFFGAFVLYQQLKQHVAFSKIAQILPELRKKIAKKDSEILFGLVVGIISVLWVVLSMKVIIPSFRGGEHFGSDYYRYLGQNPFQAFPVIFRGETFKYLAVMMSPLGFLSILSPIHLAIAIPEFAIVLLSSNGNMRNIYFHYTSVITPFIFISALYAAKLVYHSKRLSSNFSTLGKPESTTRSFWIIVIITVSMLYSSYTLSSLPLTRGADLFPWTGKPAMVEDMKLWKEYLKDENLKVSTTGHLAPHFTSRRYFYDFSWKYTNADYVLIDTHEVQYGYLKEKTVPAYIKLQSDWRYIKLYDKHGLQVYKKITSYAQQ